jgi:hypothetical protein
MGAVSPPSKNAAGIRFVLASEHPSLSKKGVLNTTHDGKKSRIVSKCGIRKLRYLRVHEALLASHSSIKEQRNRHDVPV